MKISLCSAEFSVAGFIRDWNHCDQISEYLATTVSLDKPEAFRYGNLLSPMINEILETVHLSDRLNSSAEIEILTEGPVVHVDLHLDSDDSLVNMYHRISEQMTSGKLEELYRQALISDSPHPEVGILRLITQYGAEIAVRNKAAGRATVELSVVLDRFVEVPS